MEDMRTSNGRRLWLVVAAALLVRGALLVSAAANGGSVLTPDSHSYLQLAGALAERGEFALHDQPEIFRTPGYPLFLAWAHPLPGGVWALLAVQVLLDVALVVVTFHLAGMLAGRRAGELAAAFQAVTPVAMAASCRVLSDSLYALLLTGAVALLVAHLRGGKWRPLLAGAFVMAAACYVRPIGVAMAVVAAAVVLCRRRCVLRAIVFAAVVAACLAPWVVRNAAVADFRGFSSFAGESLHRFAAAEIIARREGTDAATVRRRLDAEVILADLPTPGARSRYRKQQAMEIIGGDRGAYLTIHAAGAMAFWLPGATDVLEVSGATVGQRGTLEVLHSRGPVAAARHYFADSPWAIAPAVLLAGMFAVKMFGVAVCAVSRARLRMSAAAWLMLLIVATSSMAGGAATTPRFRVPIAPLLSVAAAVGWLRLSRRRRAGAHASSLPADADGDAT